MRKEENAKLTLGALDKETRTYPYRLEVQGLSDEGVGGEVGDGDAEVGCALHLTEDGVVGTFVACPRTAGYAVVNVP